MAELLAAYTGVAPAPSAVATLHQRTEGNPFFVGEFVRALAAEGSLVGADQIEVPATVKLVIERRLGRLSEPCRRTLRTAAVIGREFSSAMLERTSAAAAPEDAVAAVVAEAAAALVVTAIPGTSAAWRFAHALFNETLYEEIPPPERAELHGCVGAAMEETLDAEEHLAELAYHFGASQQKDDARRALSYARRAGDRALALLAYEEAARLYEMAISALERAAPLDEPARGELLLSLGEAHKRAGSADDAKRAFLRAADVGRAVGRPSCSPALHSASRRRSSGPRRRSPTRRARVCWKKQFPPGATTKVLCAPASWRGSPSTCTSGIRSGARANCASRRSPRRGESVIRRRWHSPSACGTRSDADRTTCMSGWRW